MNKLILLSSLVTLSLSAAADPLPSFGSFLSSKSLLTDIVNVNNKLVAVGDRGHILYSPGSVHVWIQAKVPVSVLLTDVFFLNEKRGWVVGHDATILMTDDGGENWSLQHNSPQMDKPLFGVHFKDKDNGIAFGAYGLFMRTKDGGASWQQEFHEEFLHPDDQDYLNDLKENEPDVYKDETQSILPHFNRLTVDGQNAYLVGEVGLLAKSTDYGVNWTKVEPFYNGSFFDVAKVPGHGLFVAGLRGNVFISKGEVNQFQALAIDGKTSVNRVLSSGDNIVLVGNSGLFLSSSDGGKTFKSNNQSDGKAITGGVFVGDKLVLTSEVGIKVIEKGQW